jgi:alkanesulfonate monooxygenase SsuD/methylene tetrahydromethanopterin reductase-like flavin-dependent oxidoreductase (luciferase family)
MNRSGSQSTPTEPSHRVAGDAGAVRSISLSVLDSDDEFRFARELGPYVESLGYRRYWFTEHVPQPSVEMLVTLLAGLTDTLRVGTGGVVLPSRHVPQCALNFQLLADLFDDRIDAGFCAARGFSPEWERQEPARCDARPLLRVLDLPRLQHRRYGNAGSLSRVVPSEPLRHQAAHLARLCRTVRRQRRGG